MSFEKLMEELDELQSLQKSAPIDDDRQEGGDNDDAEIAAAAEEGEGEVSEGDDEGHAEPDGDEGEGEGDGDGDEKPFGKSFRFQTEDGEEVEAIDGTELLKSLMGRVESNEESMTKALGSAIELLKSQGSEISLLKSEVARLASAGRGRKTIVTVTEKPAPEALQKSEPAGLSGGEFMAKAISAHKAGRISSLEVATAEGFLNKGQAVPANIVNRVLSA